MKIPVVYPVCIDPKNGYEQLRHSIRSVRTNMPNCPIVIVGYCPDFIRYGKDTNIRYLPLKDGLPTRDSYMNTFLAINEVINNGYDKFWLFNEDFFVNKFTKHFPDHHRGTVQDLYKAYLNLYSYDVSRYMKEMKQSITTFNKLGFEDAKSFELHYPMCIRAENWEKMVEKYKHLPNLAFLKRSLYGNLYLKSATFKADVKVYDQAHYDFEVMDMISTCDFSWHSGAVGRYIRKKFSIKLPFEK